MQLTLVDIMFIIGNSGDDKNRKMTKFEYKFFSYKNYIFFEIMI